MIFIILHKKSDFNKSSRQFSRNNNLPAKVNIFKDNF